MRGAPLSLPIFALLSLSASLTVVELLGACSLQMLVGLCIWWCKMVTRVADTDAEQLALTEQLFDAALG